MLSYTVIISTYNGLNFIEEQVCSIVEQSLPPGEILIRDDGSTDGTCEVLTKLAKKYDNINLVLGNNIGYIKSYSRLMAKAIYPIIFLCDQDDVWLPNKAKMHVEKHHVSCVDLVISNAFVTNQSLERIRKLNLLPPICTLDGILKNNFVIGACTSISKDFVLGLYDCIDIEIPHDFQIGFWAIRRRSISYIHLPLTLYRQHGGNEIGTNTSIFQKYLSIFNLRRLKNRKNFYLYRLKLLRSLDISETADYSKMVDIYNGHKLHLSLRLLLKFRLRYILSLCDRAILNLCYE